MAQQYHDFSKIIQHFPKFKWGTQRNLGMIAHGNCFALGNGSSVETVRSSNGKTGVDFVLLPYLCSVVYQSLPPKCLTNY